MTHEKMLLHYGLIPPIGVSILHCWAENCLLLTQLLLELPVIRHGCKNRSNLLMLGMVQGWIAAVVKRLALPGQQDAEWIPVWSRQQDTKKIPNVYRQEYLWRHICFVCKQKFFHALRQLG